VPSVLLIDSDEPSRKLARLVLEDAKWRVVAVPSMDDATAALSRSTPDLIVTDLVQLSDCANVTELRLSALDTPIVAVTSLDRARAEPRAIAAGCVGYIQKPIDIATFESQVRAFARNRK
jgi:two-component system cell cycle response regulator DivK